MIATAVNRMLEAEAPLADALAQGYRAVRSATERLCRTLVTEDYVVQSMPDVSPAKWHLAHTTWFFETFILADRVSGYQPFDPAFKFLFNSYYVTVGDRHCRQNRGQLSRPTVDQIYAYRRFVDEAMSDYLAGLSPTAAGEIAPLIEIGLHHEQQHQELLVMDLKHIFWVNPLRPAYLPKPPASGSERRAAAMTWIGFNGGLNMVGHDGVGFAFDNEGPRHKVFLEPFQLGSRLVTNGEYKSFMVDGGYSGPSCGFRLESPPQKPTRGTRRCIGSSRTATG